MHGDGWQWGFGFGHWVFGVLFWVLVLVAIVGLFRFWSASGNGRQREKAALDILKERYARGEIDKDEFEHKRRDLSNE